MPTSDGHARPSRVAKPWTPVDKWARIRMMERKLAKKEGEAADLQAQIAEVEAEIAEMEREREDG